MGFRLADNATENHAAGEFLYLTSILKENSRQPKTHVRATAFLDQELQSVQEKDYPGVTHLRHEINSAFPKTQLSSIPHSEVLSKIDEAGKTFSVLFIKTNTTIPYTSVYMRLDCGYMTDEVESKIRNAVAVSANK
jgi:hypothetical protein